MAARAGYGGRNVLIYGTRGAAWASLEHSFTTNPFILGNASGSDLRRADAFEFGSLRFVLGYRF